MVALLLDENETNDDGVDKGERKKNICFFNKTTPLHVHHALFHIYFPSLHHYDMKTANFPHSLYGVSEHKTEIVFLFF